jgi:hypothetical protein
MSITEISPDDLIIEDIVWPEPVVGKPRPAYVNKAEGMEQARSLYLQELEEMTMLIKDLRARVPEVVKLAKSNGATWEEIGNALGTSRQAACRTYNELIEA